MGRNKILRFSGAQIRHRSTVITRFAPSPSGRLHLGHAYSALRAWDFARKSHGELILRIEDVDFNRCKKTYENLLKEDLAWLGLQWQEPTRRQSDHLDDYTSATNKLDKLGLLYPCFCSRREIRAEIARAGAAPHGSEGPVYPGTCRYLSEEQRADRMASGDEYALRLNLRKALQLHPRLQWQDLEHGEITIKPQDWDALGDAVMVRKDIQTSYHIAVVVDDALQGITHVVRGLDLFGSTHIHVLLQAMLELPQPIYLHHALVTDERTGKRFAKRDASQSLASLRDTGVTVENIRKSFQMQDN